MSLSSWVKPLFKNGQVQAPYSPVNETTLNEMATAIDDLVTFANGGPMPYLPGRGCICFVADDGLPSIATIGPLLAAASMRGTFGPISSNIGDGTHATSAQILALFQAGHEIASHSKTHPHIATGGLTAAQRAAEYDNSKATIEAIIGAGNCRTFIYPYGDWNATTQAELYLRYDRVCADAGWGLSMMPVFEHSPTLISRVLWTSDSHDNVMSAIQQAAYMPGVLVLEIHGISDLGEATDPLSLADLNAGIALAHSLNVPGLTVSQAFGCQSSYLLDPGFETSDLTLGVAAYPWFIGSNVGTGNVAEIIADTPEQDSSFNLTGTKSLHLKTAGDTNVVYVVQKMIVKPSTPYTLSWRSRGTKASGTGRGYCFIREYAQDGTIVTTTNSTPTITSNSAWTGLSQAVTTAATTRYVGIGIELDTLTGELWADHMHFGETVSGVLG